VMLLVLRHHLLGRHLGPPAGLAGTWDRRPAGWNPGGSLEAGSARWCVHQVLPIDWVVLFASEAWWPFRRPRAYCPAVVVGCNGYARQWQVPLAAGMACTGVLIGLFDALLPTDSFNRAGIAQVVGGGRRRGTFPVALAIFVVLFFSTVWPRRRDPRTGLFAPMLTLGGGPWPGRRRSDRAVGRSGPQHRVLPGMGAFMAACARHTIDGHVPHLRPSPRILLILKPLMVGLPGSFLMARVFSQAFRSSDGA